MIGMKKIFTVCLILLVFLVSGCVNSPKESENASYTNLSSSVEKVEIIHFHWTNQCNSCIAVGSLAEKTVNTYFSEE